MVHSKCIVVACCDIESAMPHCCNVIYLGCFLLHLPILQQEAEKPTSPAALLRIVSKHVCAANSLSLYSSKTSNIAQQHSSPQHSSLSWVNTIESSSVVNTRIFCTAGEAGPSSRPDVAHILPHQSSGIRIAAAWAASDYSAADEPEPPRTSQGDMQGAESLKRGGVEAGPSRRGSMDPGSGAFGAALAAHNRRGSPARKTARSLSYVGKATFA